MQLCEEIADGLGKKNHQIAVLTSEYKCGEEYHVYPIYRLVELSPDYLRRNSVARQFFFGRKLCEKKAVGYLREIVSEFNPDVIFVFHGIGLPRLMLRFAEHIPGVKVVYYLANYLPELPDEYYQYWQNDAVNFPAKFIKPILKPIAKAILSHEGNPIILEYQNTICVSEYVRRSLVMRRLIPPTSIVIHNGINLADFTCFPPSFQNTNLPIIRFLVAGNMVHEKGVHTVIDAFAILKNWGIHGNLTLTILGDGKPEYLNLLKARNKQHNLSDIIQFLPGISRDKMPEILRQYNVLILSSEYPEPLARAMQEAMAMGLLVIGTNTGGSGELLEHEKTGLVFNSGDPIDLAEKISRVINEPNNVLPYALAGQQTVIRNFSIQRTIDQIDNYLKMILI